MSATSVSAGSQPAIDFYCDRCGRLERLFVDTYGRARILLGQSGWQVDPHAADLCPDCRRTHYDAGPVGPEETPNA